MERCPVVLTDAVWVGAAGTKLADHAGIGETRGPFQIASFNLHAVEAVQLGRLAATRAALTTAARDMRACVADAPLYCNTASMPERCIGAGRHCGTGEDNTRDPYVEFTWPHMPDRYLWAIKLTLPPNQQLSRLMVGTKELRLYGPRGELVPCAEGEVLRDGAVVRTDQAHLETVLPRPGGLVRVVNGGYRGEEAELVRVDAERFQALVRITQGTYMNREVWLDYEDVSKAAAGGAK